MKRKLAGAVVMLVVASLLGAVLPLPASVQSWLQPALAGLVGAGAGGFVARNGFLPVALVVQLCVWVLIVHLLHAIANGQSPYTQIIVRNLGVLAISMLAAVLGALLGQRLAGSRGPSAVTAGA
ncbi:hypothetical protein [Lysobacter xanthus]